MASGQFFSKKVSSFFKVRIQLVAIQENLSYAKGEGGIFLTIFDETRSNVFLLRKAQGLTQEELAFRAHLSVYCLQTVEYGCTNATTDTLICIAKALLVDPRVLGIFSRSDTAILSEIRQPPQFPQRMGGNLHMSDNIVLMRKERGLSQKQLAKISKMSVSYLRDIEKGCANVTINKLLCIANALDLPLIKLSFLSTPEEELMKAVYMARARARIGVGKE